MAAAHRSVSSPSHQRRKNLKLVSDKRVVPLRGQKNTTLPLGIQLLHWLQHSSVVVTFGLIGTTLFIYAMTVYNQQLWSQEYRKLEDLQRHQRDLTTTHEVFKNQLAKDGERNPQGLVTPQPSHTIFLPIDEKQVFETPKPQSTKKNKASFFDSPVGY